MPGARTRIKPLSASEFSASDEASQLDLHLQRQLEEDVARIFDESIYSDLEVVCGKLKILTHSCILKARTNKFYHKLETILHANIGRSTFDEIYSFISDAYTECNIKHQEKEIITYLDENLNIYKSVSQSSWSTKEDKEESEVFLTPKCISPYIEKAFHKSISSSPSTELTKEYYALVPIEGNLLDKELIEQDVLSNAFHSIIKAQSDDLSKIKVSQCNKPTSLSLSSSHTSKTVKHSNSCDILIKCHIRDSISNLIGKSSDKNLITTSQRLKTTQNLKTTQIVESVSNIDYIHTNSEQVVNKALDATYSPDSLITDDPSSSSDYLSAAYTCSPGVGSSGCFAQLNVGDHTAKMDNIFTSSDSGLENTGMLESLSSHKDVTLTDVSLTESTLHDLTIDDANNSHDSTSSPLADKNQLQGFKFSTSSQPIASICGSSTEKSNQSIYKDMISGKSSKEEKQRQNEEIVILESSSLSSETGSWESVFPPKLAEKDICEKFITHERQFCTDGMKCDQKSTSDFENQLRPSLVQKSPFKSTSCFIDAASLADEDDDTKIHSELNEISGNVKSDIIPAPSQPVPCSTVKLDISPNDWSESNENEDSLEQPDHKDPDSIQKDLSPTIFEMTPITEDSLCTNAFENAIMAEENVKTKIEVKDTSTCMAEKSLSSSTVLMSSTPHNSIMSLKSSSLKHYESEESESDATIVGREEPVHLKKFKKYNESSPIISGGASIEDHLPHIGSNTSSPLMRRRIENTPIVSGAYIPQVEDTNLRKSSKLTLASAWVVDMSSTFKSDGERNISGVNNNQPKKPGDRTFENLKNESISSCVVENCNKSRSSVDSDSSERSSQKFYIDLSSLPDPSITEKSNESESVNEKKNIFSMYIDLGDKSNLKEMPARLSSSLNSKRNPPAEIKSTLKTNKCTKTSSSECAPILFTNECSFEKYESLCNDPSISISEIIGFPDTKKSVLGNKVNSESEQPKAEKKSNDKAFHYNATMITQEEITDEPTTDLFVKLSDLDKPIQKNDISMIVNDETILDARMTRSIPDNNWGDQSHTGNSKSIEVISSFHSENALSLNRLFPHLKNEFSRSMPGSLSGRTRSPLRLGMSSSPGEIEEQASDMSEISSVQSSMCRSVVENSTTEETSQTSSLIGNCQSRLGQDLLRMFLEEIAPDVIVEVSGRRIKAHKCILSSRCQYFAGILSGGWVESAGNVIVLPPFSFNVVHFALCHIYSGVSTIPDSISIVELATLADMLGLEGLKEAIMFTLKAKYCHHFHRPCAVCTAGVLECFPLSSVYGLDDLYRKCLRWITKYFSKVWPTKAFATLPKELLDKCYQQHIVNLTIDNVVDTVYGCGITVASLEKTRWAESVARMCRRLENAAAQFAAARLAGVIRAAAGQWAPAAPPPAARALDDCLAAAIQWAPPDEACRAYAYLSALVADLRAHHHPKPDLITDQTGKPAHKNLLYNHAAAWRLQCEGALVRAAPRVVGTQAFKDLPSDLRKRLRELGCIMYGAQAAAVAAAAAAVANAATTATSATSRQERRTRNPHTRNRSSTGHRKDNTRSLDIDHVRASFVPYAPKPPTQMGSIDILKSNNDLRDSRKSVRTIPPKVRTTKAQEERAKFNMSKTNQSQDRLNNKSGTARNSFENTKPRYLELRVCKDSDKKISPPKKLIPKMVSSTESSRNSSPIQSRNLRTSRMKSPQTCEVKAQAMSQDSLATSSRPRTAEPSTDSLSESQTSNKYGTYTKTKHTPKGSIEALRSSSKCQSTTQATSSKSKIKTKIPVYLNQNNKFNKEGRYNGESQMRCPSKQVSNVINTSVPSKNKNIDRKVPGSLMNATKSSSAKIVHKIIKETPTNKVTKYAKGTLKQTNRHEERSHSPSIPVMERSGTFLKDEPTFGDKTTNIDIYQ